MTTSADVPGRLPCAIDGHPFLCEAEYERTTVDVIRQQSDASTEPGEQSLTPYGLWRRSQESWHHGAGQDFLDGKDEKAADPHRFRSSKGIDPWTRGQVSLLHPTLRAWSSGASNLYLAIAQMTSSDFDLFISDTNAIYSSVLPYSQLNTYVLQQGTGWTVTNGTIATSGDWFRITATGAGTVSATSPSGLGGMPVNAGRTYAVVFASAVTGGAALIPTVAIVWYNAAGSVISTTTAAVAAGDDTTLATVTTTAVAPALTAFAAVTISWSAAWGAGDIHTVRQVSFGPADDVATYPFGWTLWDIQGGQAAQAVQSMASDGSNVWAALGTSGLHLIKKGTGVIVDQPAAPASGQVSLVGYANGFLLAAGSAGTTATLQNSLWLVTSPLGPAAPALSLIKTHPNTNFAWTFISGGRSVVYAGGNSGGNGEIYKITYDPNTASLSTAASPATSLPDGETIYALYFYAGGIILGTGKGLRLGQADGAGNIDYGPLIPTPWPVKCLEPQDRYCWFGWTKYDTTNSGLGRVDLGFFTDPLTPAWASDLMTPTASSGDVVSCVTLTPLGYSAIQRPPVRVFTVAGKGVYIEDPGSRQAIGTLETGTIRYNTSEPKTARSVDVRHHAFPASSELSVNLLRDNNPALTLLLGSSSVTDSYGVTLTTGSVSGEAFELRFTLERPDDGGADYTRTPELTRWTLKALPLPSTIDETFTLTLLMKAQIETNQGESIPLDVPTEVAYIKALEQARTIISFQVGNSVYTGYVVKSQFKGEHWVSPAREYAEGKLTVILQTVRG